MDNQARENSKGYLKWLMAMCVAGSCVGWTVQGLMSGTFLLWTLPIFLLGTVVSTANGDNIVESVVLLLILGVVLFAASRVDAIVERAGDETLLSGYLALSVSKIGFALAKSGAFRNKRFN